MKTRAMKVTAEIKKLFDEGSVKASLSLTVEGVLVIRGARLVDGKNGLFVSMPSRKNAAGEYYDICFPNNNDTRLLILGVVKDAYEKALKEQSEAAEAAASGDADGGEQEPA